MGSDGVARLATYRHVHSVQDVFRSVLYFEAGFGPKPEPKTGAAAIEAYLNRQEGGRLIQSIKSLASDRLFRHTQINGHLFTFEDLVAAILRGLKTGIDADKAGPGPVVVGRPVRFVGAKTAEDDEFAIGRLRRACEQAGFENVLFEFEPVGAAWFYETRLDHDELVLIADFGGGTSDFSLLKVGPGVRKRGRTAADLVGTEGVAVAGDSFDAALVRHLVSPLLGRGSFYRSLGKTLPMPHSIYRRLERWHHLSFLRSRETMLMLRSLEAQAENPEMLRLLIELVEGDFGFQLHRAIQAAKMDLSRADGTLFRFAEPGLTVERPVSRREFESWIEDDLNRFQDGLDRLLNTSGVDTSDVDRVFLTGGTSFVPCVRRLFEDRFGAERIRLGGEFTSVAAGLALRAHQLTAV